MITGSINPIQSIGKSAHTVQLTELAVGKIYPAEILGIAANESIIVRISGVLLNISTSETMAPGDILNLQYLGASPNPTFLLVGNASSPSLNKIDISTTSDLITQYQDDAKVRGRLIEISTAQTPLIESALDPAEIAKTLKSVIENSGLFYESHLADFKEGKRSLDSLLQEPQNQPHFDPSQVISKQLDIFEKQSITWHGTIWENQQMSWTLGRDNPRAHSKDSGTTHSFISTLDLDLPNLKKVNIHLKIQNGTLSVQIGAENPAAEAMIRTQTNQLASNLYRSGQKLESLLVKKHE